MKKYIYMMLVVLTAGFASCSNDDIPMEEDVTMKTFETTFKINPKTVIEPFTWEFNSGELQTFDEKYQLRVRLLLYNQVGDYIGEDIQKFPNYMVTMESSMQLQAGSYKAIVITDLELKKPYPLGGDYVEEYWKLSDYKEGNLSKLKITSAGYTGGKNKILGISHQNFTIAPNGINEVKIDVEPAGAIIATRIVYPHYFDFVKQMQLGTNKLVNEYIFNIDGSYLVNEDVDERYDNKRLLVFDNTVFEGESCNHYIYDYVFILPAKYNLKWLYSDTYEDFEDMYELHDTPMTLDIQAGDEWLVGVNLKENNYYTPEKVGASSAFSSIGDTNSIFIPKDLRIKR